MALPPMLRSISDSFVFPFFPIWSLGLTSDSPWSRMPNSFSQPPKIDVRIFSCESHDTHGTTLNREETSEDDLALLLVVSCGRSSTQN